VVFRARRGKGRLGNLAPLFPENGSGAKIPHSSIVVFQNEYEFTEDGIMKRPARQVSQAAVVQIHHFKNSLKRTPSQLENFVKELRTKFNRQSYSLMKCNCNHFSLKLLHFFGVDTEFLSGLAGYGGDVLSRSVKIAGGLGVGGVLSGIGALAVSEVGVSMVAAMSSGPIGAAVATVGTVAVGTGAAGITGTVVKKIFNSRTSVSGDEEDENRNTSPPAEFDPF